MHYVVTVTEVTQPEDSAAGKDILVCERFKQHIEADSFDLRKFVVALNAPPRGRPATMARAARVLAGGGK